MSRKGCIIHSLKGVNKLADTVALALSRENVEALAVLQVQLLRKCCAQIGVSPTEAAEELEGHVAAALPEMMDSRTVLERELLGWMRKPIDAKLEEANPTAALLQRLAKYGASNWLMDRDTMEGGGSRYRAREGSVTAVK